jgi:hypothetical protein
MPLERLRLLDCLVSDDAFDAVYPPEIRGLSERHWTPVDVAARAANLLLGAGATRILDVGSGAGKFCVVGALSTDAEFVGVERRQHLVSIARHTATRLGATRATFVHADVSTFSFERFDGVYLYNPFTEQICPGLQPIDHTIEFTCDAYHRFIELTVSKLRAMSPPAAIATFHGFGGDVPSDFFLELVEPAATDRLELWVKR